MTWSLTATKAKNRVSHCGKQEKHYFAFISYKREDEEWAKWFQNESENYHLPFTLNGRDDLPQLFRPVFRDIDELKAGNLPMQIYNALATSLNLVVVCSPKLADDENAKWVNKEISDFIEIGKKDGTNNLRHIFPFIVDGVPHAGDERECFPKALRELSKEHERIGGNINEGGNVSDINRECAFVKVLAGMLPDSVSFDMLWNRYDRDKMERERKEKEERDKLLIAQSRFVAEKARALLEDGDSYNARRVLLEVIPGDLDNPNRPMVTEVESSLRGSCVGNAAVFRGQNIHQAVFSPDGKRIVSASLDGHVDVWNMEDGSLTMTLKHAPCVMGVDYSLDANLIVTSSSEGEVVLWETKTCGIVSTLYSNEDKQCVRSVVFSPNGELVAATLDNNILLLETKSRRLLKVFKGHRDSIISVSFSPDGRFMVSASGDNTAIIWDLKKEDPLHILKNHSDVVNYASFSHDGKRIASASMNQTIGIWDVSSGNLITIVDQINGWVNSAVFNPDNANQVLFASPQAGVWGVDVTNDMSSEVGKIGATFATYSSDGRFVAAVNVNDSIKIYDTRGSIPLLEMPVNRVISVAFGPKDKLIVSYSANDVVQILDSATGRRFQAHKGCIKDIKQMVFSPDGSRMVLVSYCFCYSR